MRSDAVGDGQGDVSGVVDVEAQPNRHVKG
jgi:hypothetical protein